MNNSKCYEPMMFIWNLIDYVIHFMQMGSLRNVSYLNVITCYFLTLFLHYIFYSLTNIWCVGCRSPLFKITTPISKIKDLNQDLIDSCNMGLQNLNNYRIITNRVENESILFRLQKMSNVFL